MAVTSEYLQEFGSYTLHSLSLKLVLVYLTMVALAGWWTRRTKPAQLNTLMVVYNTAIVSLSTVCCGLFLRALVLCPHLYGKTRDPSVEAASRLYWQLKMAQLLDTVFMVLRHKSRQISPLHVYHHVSIVLLTDYYHHLAPWPAFLLPATLNAATHVCLYTYYGLSSLGVSLSHKWRRRLTELELCQFAVGLVHCTVGYLRHGFCVYSMVYGVSMTAMFANFYTRAYVLRRKERKIELNGMENNRKMEQNGTEMHRKTE